MCSIGRRVFIRSFIRFVIIQLSIQFEPDQLDLLAGDLLRAEQTRPDSKAGAMIKEYIKEGKIVPMEVTIQLLENAMREAINSGAAGANSRFLVDGFPRQLDQAYKFDESVRTFALSSLVILIESI